MHLVSHMLESVCQKGSGESFMTDISEQQHIANVIQAYQSSNNLDYIRQMLKHCLRCTGLDHTEEELSYLALHGWYDGDSAKMFIIPSATDARRSTCRAHLLRLQTIHDEPIICPISQLVYDLRETHGCGVCRGITIASLRDASDDFGIPNFGDLLRAQIEDDWRHEVSGLMLRYYQNVLIDCIFIELQKGRLCYCPRFHNLTSVEHLGLDCKAEYTHAKQGIMPEAHNIWGQYTQSEENDLNNTFQGQIPSFPVWAFSWTPPNQIIQFREHLPARKSIPTFSKMHIMPQQWALRPKAQEYVVVIATKFKDPFGWADCIDRLIRVVKQTNIMHILPGGVIVGPPHMKWENAALGGIISAWLVNTHVNLNTYWTVH